MKAPWWIGAPAIVTTLFSAYLVYESQRTYITFTHTQTIAAQLKAYGEMTPKRYIGLNNQIAESYGVLNSYDGTLDKSKITFASAEKNGVPGFAFSMTVSGLNKRDCENLELNVLFDSVIVNGEKIIRDPASIADRHALCRSTFWPWSDKNIVELIGS